MNQRLLTAMTVGALTACVALVGCNKRDQTDARNAGNDSSIAQTDQQKPRGNEAQTGMPKDSTSPMAPGSIGSRMGDKVSDAVITTSVKAEIAKDANLSALKISVDTDSGRVVLHGTAPSAEARDHASSLAQGVKGVTSVDNQLTVEPGKM